MARVLAIVRNSVSFDARVRRQSASLRAAGHEVHVIGRKDQAHPQALETWPDGVTIERTGPVSGKRHTARPGKRLADVGDDEAPSGSQGAAPQRALVGNDKGHLPRPIFAFRHSGRPWRMPRRILAARIKEMRLGRHGAGWRPDVVHAHDVAALPFGAFAARYAQAPLIFDAHELYDQVGGTSRKDEANRRMVTHTIARFARDVSGLVTINDSFAEYYAKHYGELPAAVVVANATSAPPMRPYDGRLHDAAGVARDRRLILYQGGFSHRRNLVELVTTADHLDDRWALVFMGWGPLEGALGEARARLSTAGRDRVRVLDRVPHAELMRWTSGATLGVIPYGNCNLNHWFCTPNKLWEFPQARVPVLVSPFPELRARVERFGHGWLLSDPFDPVRMAHLVNGLDDAAIGRARDACDRFNAVDNWELYERRLFALYHRLLDRKVVEMGADALAERA